MYHNVSTSAADLAFGLKTFRLRGYKETSTPPKVS